MKQKEIQNFKIDTHLEEMQRVLLNKMGGPIQMEGSWKALMLGDLSVEIQKMRKSQPCKRRIKYIPDQRFGICPDAGICQVCARNSGDEGREPIMRYLEAMIKDMALVNLSGFLGGE